MPDQNETQQQSPAVKMAPVFDGSKRFRVPILSGMRKECEVRYPTDAEWCERARKFRSVRRFLGRGKSEQQSINSDAINLDLFERIRLDKDGPAFDGSEAAAVLSKLDRVSVDSCEREGDAFRVTLRVPGAVTEHFVRMPTSREMDQHSVASVKVVGERKAQEVREFLEPSGELYDAMHKDHSGYNGPVPIVHKVAVVAEVLIQMAAEDEEAIPEE
jgi:hypothetical protein